MLGVLAMGASMNIYNVPYIAYIQENFPKEVHGRTFSLVGSLMSLAMPIGLLIAGPVAEHYGLTLWFVIAGIAIVIIMSTTGAIIKLRMNDI